MSNTDGSGYLKGGLAASNLWAQSGVQVNGGGCIETGFGVDGKEVNAGKICYGAFDDKKSLDVVGAGQNGSRSVRLWDNARTDALQLGNKWRLSGAGDSVGGNDGWLRLTNPAGTQYAAGGLAAQNLTAVENVLAKNVNASAISTTSGVTVPSSAAALSLIEQKGPGSAAADRYGLAQRSGAARVFASGTNPAATVGLSFAKADGTFQDALTASPKGTVDVRGDMVAAGNVTAMKTLDVRGNANVQGRVFFKNGDAVSASGTAANDTDAYFMEKVSQGNENNNHLRLTINDDPDESFQIWGDSCRAPGSCGGPGMRAHQFTANGDTWHRGSVSSGRGLSVQDTDPGPLVEKQYGADRGSRYGVGQFPNGQTRMYAASSHAPATVNLSFAKPDGSFADVLTANNDASLTTATGLKISGAWSGYPDNSSTRSEISNDTRGFKQLMIVGNKSAGGERRVGVWDRLDVNGTLNTTGHSYAASVGRPRENNDWFRINQAHGGNPAQAGVAMYNGVAINDGGGLSVGAWKKVPNGSLETTGDARVGGKLCLQDKCITKDQLSAIMQKAGV